MVFRPGAVPKIAVDKSTTGSASLFAVVFFLLDFFFFFFLGLSSGTSIVSD